MSGLRLSQIMGLEVFPLFTAITNPALESTPGSLAGEWLATDTDAIEDREDPALHGCSNLAFPMHHLLLCVLCYHYAPCRCLQRRQLHFPCAIFQIWAVLQQLSKRQILQILEPGSKVIAQAHHQSELRVDLVV